MYDWNTVVVGLFLVTYLPFFWFFGMRMASSELFRHHKQYELNELLFVPRWALVGANVFFILHYGIFLVLLSIVDWVHGLAAFGIGVLLFIFLPIIYRTYPGIFKTSAMRIYRLDPATGRLMIKMLRPKKALSTGEGKSDSMTAEEVHYHSEK